MNQPVRNPQQQRMTENAAQGNRPQDNRPTGLAGQPMQQGRPMQQQQNRLMQQGRPMQQQQNRPIQQGIPMQQQGRPMQQGRPIQPQQGRPMQQGRPIQPQQGRSMQQGSQQNAPAAQQSAQSKPKKNPYVPNFASDFNLSPAVITTKGIFAICLVTLIIGMFLGNIFFGGSSSSNQKPSGLVGVVKNPDITTKLPRCGLIDRGRSCILYIMNSTRYDKTAEDFFDEAVKLTEIQKYSIAMVNLKYAKTPIPPGRFAEIKIPDMR